MAFLARRLRDLQPDVGIGMRGIGGGAGAELVGDADAADRPFRLGEDALDLLRPCRERYA